jgi:hypothetical protein
MESITGHRAILNSRGDHGELDEQEVLDGQTTISLETCADLQDEDILTYIQDNFAEFLKIIRFLSKEDQELLLSYYILSKMLDVDTPIPTPSGWKRNGDIQDGDLVFDERGMPTRVLKAHPARYPDTSYEVQLDSGERIYAGDEHLWLTSTYNDRQRAKHRKVRRGNENKVRTTQEIFETQRHKPSPKEAIHSLANHHIQLTSALELPESTLPVDPYCLGVWLGDGNSDCGILTASPKDAHEILAHFSNAGYAWHSNKKDSDRWHILGLYPALKKLGVIKNKHIPAEYLRASASQRLALLQGLMDSDGYDVKQHGGCGFSNCNSAIVAGMSELLWSLGIKHQFRYYRASCMYKGVPRYSDSWKAAFTTHVPCFRLPRKLAVQKQKGLKEGSLSHHIVKVSKTTPRLMRCLTVDSPSHLYLCGKSMVPTHNTQNTLALIHKSTQTVCSFRIRQAVKRIGTFMMLGVPTEEVIAKVLKKAKLENELPQNIRGEQISLSKVIILYEETRSFQQVADAFGLHRPDIRRTMSRVAKTLSESKEPQDMALAAFVHGLIDKASASGQGFSKRKLGKLCHSYRQDSDILGKFVVDLTDPDINQIFTSRANR